MELIFIAVLIYWAITVAGALVAWRWYAPKIWRVTVAVVTAFVFVLGLPIASAISPVDWFLPAKSVRASGYINGYRVDYVQTPGNDFYGDTLEIFGPSGNSAIIYTSPDNPKCWFGATHLTETFIEFSCFPWGLMASIEADWVSEKMQACTRKECDLSRDYFNR